MSMTGTDDAVVKAEVIAIQAVLISVFRRMAADRPELAPVFCSAFDEAETILAGVAVKMGLEAPAESTLGALRVIEELRRAVIRDESVCREAPPPGARRTNR
jgi:hypothetical protein